MGFNHMENEKGDNAETELAVIGMGVRREDLLESNTIPPPELAVYPVMPVKSISY